MVEAEPIGIKLSIHTDLAAFILVELTELEYVDSNGQPTSQGLKVLSEDSIEAHDMVTGYVFQDPWNGDLWPRFVERLDYCELEFDESDFPKLLLGTKGGLKRQGAFMVLPGNTPLPGRPTPASVVAAISGHRKGLRFRDNLADPDDGIDYSQSTISHAHFVRVAFIEEEPTPVFLMTYLYLPADSSGDTDWYACDPFGLGISVRLRRKVEQIMQTMPSLYDVVNRMVGRGVYDGLEEQKRWIDQLRVMARLEVERRMTVNIRSFSAFDQITDMEFANQEVLLLGQDCPESKFKHALRLCSAALEASFGAYTEKYPLGDVWKRVYVNRYNRRTGKQYLAQQQDKELLKAIYETAFGDVGFGGRIPDSLLNVRPGHIRSVAEHGEQEHWRLRPLLMALVLSAHQNIDHPLRQVATIYPTILTDLDQVAMVGGWGGHSSKNKFHVSYEDFQRTVDLTYSILSAITGFGQHKSQTVDHEKGLENV